MQLNNDYQRDDFLKFLEEDFLTDFKRDIRSVNTSSLSSIQKANYLGESRDLDLQVFEFLFEGSPNKRIALTKDAFSVMRSSAIYNALAVFHSPNKKDWRFSLMTATPEPTQKGKVSLSYSNPRRLSFFLGPNAKTNTPTKFLINKGKIIDLEDLKKRFSIEVVNREFYKEISQTFTKLVNGLLKLPSTQDKSQANIDFAVRLIGRVIFCWFLREKKSNTGIALMPKDLLSLEAVKENDDYYHKILEPIFFEVLNKPIKLRKEDFSKEPFSSVPYLNGGLFSPQVDDYYKRTNGDFQSQHHNTLIVPDSWIKSFYEILETYNFTIDENTSYDEELSIDPEMLGRIFENLLAEINPETGESARKSTGSFYTPRIIVNYMVDESLLLYLKENTGIHEEKLRTIISYDLDDDLENPVTTDEKEKIIDALEKVKILDPACGSGAFPIGALQKIVFILQQTDPDGQMWFKKQIKNTSPEIKRVVEREFAHKNFDYIRKLGIIRENIYGIDIQPIATEISRLRCFLTLVVDEGIQEDLENRGIEPLPNLDFKFVTANTLIGLPGSQTINQMGLFEDDAGIKELKELRDMFFNASGTEREQLKLEFVQSQNHMFQRLVSEGRRGHADLTTKLTTWDPFSHKTSSWFDSEWMFGIKDGFNIVIGNPPYVQLQTNGGYLANLYENQSYSTFCRSGDIYSLFYEKGIQLITNKGCLCFISSNKWMRTSYGSKLRSFLSKLNMLNLIDFAGFQVFETAAVDTTIALVQRSENLNKLEAAHFKDNYVQGDDIRDYFNKNKVDLKNLDSEPWFIGGYETISLKSKIEHEGVPIKRWPELSINYGIKTGANDVFIINEEFRNKLINLEPQSASIMKPLLRGLHTKNYYTEWENDYLLYVPWHFPLEGAIKGSSLKAEETFKVQYPRLYEYFHSRKERLLKRNKAETGIRYEWYALQRSGSSYKSDFLKPKVVWMNMNRGWKFAYSERDFYVDMTLNFLASEKYAKFMTGVLSSPVHKWYFLQTGRIFDNGGFMTKVDSVSNFPVPTINEDNKLIFTAVEKLIEKILDIKSHNKEADTIKIENELNEQVYLLYKLTPDEIEIIKEATK
ncbi:MAG: Eco57I restriction-modification methylase domain-containing protein [Candidatus Shapirobacteria bacterium]